MRMQMYNKFLNCQLFAARFLSFFIIKAAFLLFLVVLTLDVTRLRTMGTRVIIMSRLLIQTPKAESYPTHTKRHDKRHYPVLPTLHHSNVPI